MGSQGDRSRSEVRRRRCESGDLCLGEHDLHELHSPLSKNRLDRWAPARQEVGVVAASIAPRAGHLCEDGLRQAGALEEGNDLLVADPVDAVQIRAAEVGVDGRLHHTQSEGVGAGGLRKGGSMSVAGGEGLLSARSAGHGTIVVGMERGRGKKWMGTKGRGGARLHGSNEQCAA